MQQYIVNSRIAYLSYNFTLGFLKC